MTVGIEKMCHMVFFFGPHTDDTFAAAVLGAVGVRRHTLDVTGIGNGYHATVSGNKVGNIKIAVIHGDLGTPGSGIFFLDLQQFFFDDRNSFAVIGDQTVEIFDPLGQFPELILQIADSQSGQLMQTHFQNRIRLKFGKIESFTKIGMSILLGCRFTDDRNNIVKILDRSYQADHDVHTGFGSFQAENTAAENNFQTVVDVSLKHLGKIHDPGTVVIDHQHRTADGGLKGGHRIKLIQNHLPHRTFFDVNHDPDTGTVTALIPDIADPGDLLIRNHLFDTGDLVTAVNSVRNFTENDLLSAVFFNDVSFGTQPDTAAAGLIKLTQSVTAADDRSAGKVRSGKIIHKLIHGKFRIVQQSHSSINNFAEVVSGNIRRHTHTDTGRTINQQLGEFGRQYRRLDIGFIKGRHHIHSVFLDILKHLFGKTLHAALRITARSRRVTVISTEVSLPLNQRSPQAERLPQTHQSIVNS